MGWRQMAGPGEGAAGLAVRLGLTPDQRGAAALLYWQAFGAKLGRIHGPEPRALAFLERVIRLDHALCALAPDGRLVGLAGFRSPRGSFVSGSRDDFSAIYGLAGGAWRMGLILAMSREVENRRFLMDGICVAPDARGRGIGRALLSGICAEAARRGYAEVRLDVVDTNPRARALYEREGFRALREVSIGPLRHVFGFRSATTMVRAVTP